jgi:endoglucanase
MPRRMKRQSGISRRGLLKAGIICAAAAKLSSFAPFRAQASVRPPKLWGINLAGADFGSLLGKHGTEYLYPPPENIDYYAALGFTLVRIPFKWERLQPQLNAPLDGNELLLLSGVVDHALRRNLTVVLDPHNYAKRRFGADGWSRDFLIGSAEVPLGGFTDFWGRLADVFKDREQVVFGLMNEPTELTPARWLEIANAAIAEIRRRGARNMLFVPGTAWTGAHSWFDAGNTVMGGLNDPQGNFALEVHQYFDQDSSGTRPEAMSGTVGSERIEAFQNWARERGLRAFLGEYCGGRNDLSARALMDFCDELNANSDVWLGSAAWAGGPRWPEDDMFNLEPYKDGRMREQTDIIRSRATAESPRYWTGPPPRFYVDFARGIEIGTGRPHAIPRAAEAGKALPERGSLPLDRKGLRIDASSAEPSLVNGALSQLFGLPSFTVLIELRELSHAKRKRDILSVAGASILAGGARGELCSDAGGGLMTLSQPRDRGASKCRCAFSYDAATGEIVIAATGLPPVVGKEARPVFLDRSPSDARPHVQLGAGPNGRLDGYISRVVGFPFFLDRDELAKAVA